MNIRETYDYPVRARRNLWTAPERVPDEVLSRKLLDGDRFHCIKDLVFHVVATEDFWIREEILRAQPVRQTIPALKDTQGGAVFSGYRSTRCWTSGALSSRVPSLTFLHSMTSGC